MNESMSESMSEGSVIGPPSYNMVSPDLHPLHSQNVYVKYTDDTCLLVGSKHISTAASSDFNTYMYMYAYLTRLFATIFALAQQRSGSLLSSESAKDELT